MSISTSPWVPTRQAALDSLEAFMPRLPAYAFQRNFDRPGHQEVSQLSPYLRRRLISEEEVVIRVLREHSFKSAEKFIQEVAWRTYWKGWLDERPEVWHGFVARAAALEQGSKTAPWGDEYRSALAAQTHLPFFNDWVSELETTGYLHNHTRMWFASVWIFTLKLPWQIGALHMYRHLLDGDPASNTLSWRWVAGLQTKGKSYLARPDNIEKYSEGRWRPKQGELAEEAFPIQEEDAVSTHTPRATPSRLPPYSPGHQKLGLLMTLDDLSIDTELFPTKEIASIGLFAPQMTLGESPRVDSFTTQACQVTLERLKRLSDIPVSIISSAERLAPWASSNDLEGIAFSQPQTGPLQIPADALAALSVPVVRLQRRWDRSLTPFATRGFFPFWERAARFIEESF